MAGSNEGASGDFPPFNPEWFPSQIFWLAVTFGILYLVLSRRILPRLGGVIEQRHDRIAKDRDEAARAFDQAEAVMDAHAERIRQAHRKAREQLAAGKARAETQAAEKTEALSADMEQKMRKASAGVEQKRQEALASLGSAATEIAAEIVGKLTGSKPDATDLQDAVAAPAVKKVLR